MSPRELTVEPVKRKCRYCGRRYVVQKWGKSQGCPDCAPRLFADKAAGT